MDLLFEGSLFYREVFVMFKLILNLFSDVAGAIFFILKIIVVGIGKVLNFFVNVIASSDERNEDADSPGFPGINGGPPRYDVTSPRLEDRLLTQSLDD